MHNAAFDALGLRDYVYLALPVEPDRLEMFVRGLPASGFVGANVTVPYKAAVLPLVDELTPVARAVGAVNTLVVRPDGTMLGHNTDGAGFMADLRAHGIEAGCEHLRPTVSGAASLAPERECDSALVIGAGGAARSVVYALAEVGATVAVVNRTLSRADELCEAIARDRPASAGRLSAHPFPRALATLAPEAGLVVNTTSLGLKGMDDPIPWDPAVPFRPGQVVYDLVYGSPTPLLRLAASEGARAIGGLGMLVYQGALAFELWTGQLAPIEVMFEAIWPSSVS
jgi:shikimate dehydrogenase